MLNLNRIDTINKHYFYYDFITYHNICTTNSLFNYIHTLFSGFLILQSFPCLVHCFKGLLSSIRVVLILVRMYYKLGSENVFRVLGVPFGDPYLKNT